MNNLFIIVGAAGVGKSQITKYIRQNKSEFFCIKKHTTRPKRKEELERGLDEELDLIFENKFDEQINNNNSILYTRGGYNYWISYLDMLTHVKNYKNNFILLTDFNEAKLIKQRFLYDANCVIVYVHCDDSIIRERMIRDNYTTEEIEFRIKRTEPIWEEYVCQNFNTIQHVIINNHDLKDLYRQLDNLINYYN